MVRQGRQVPDVQVPVLRNEILDSLIDQELLYQESQKQHMQVDKKAVDEKYDEIKKRFKTEQEFKDAISKMEDTEAEIRSQLKKGLAIDELLKSKVVKDIQVTEEEAKKYYDEHTDKFKQAEQVKAKLASAAGGDLAGQAVDIGGVKLERKYDLDAPKGVRGRNSDNTFIKQELNLEPDKPLREGLESTYQWIEQQYNDRKAGKRTVS